MNSRSNPSRSRISDFGRAQFSELKAKIVRMPIPISPAARTVRRKRFDATAMPLAARKTARRSPAPVAIHDDGDVTGDFKSRGPVD